MKKYALIIAALTAVFLTSCAGPCMQPGFGQPGFGFGQPGFGFGQMPPTAGRAPRWSGVPFYGGVQDNGSVAWNGQSTVVRFPQHAQQFGSVAGPLPVQGGFNNPPLYGPMTVGNPGFQGGGAPRLVPSGQTVACPQCRSRIGNAPRGRFTCQKCGGTVSN